MTYTRVIPPLRTADLPALGGALGPEPEDFVVEELPAYLPSGQGEHVYLSIRKRCLTTRDVALLLARAASVAERDVGYAGMKDKHGVTTQWFSLPRAPDPERLRALPPELSVLEASRHGNKLRTGHVRGNRFRLHIVGAPDGREQRARALFERLAEGGFVNAFGAQRFGRDGSNVESALAWLRGEARLPRGRERFLSKLYASVIQAEAFNRYATARVALGTDELIAGEVVRLAGSGSAFVVERPEEETPRLGARDIVLTGPLPGPKLRPAASARARELERAALEELGLGSSELETLGRHAPGARRDLVVRPENAGVEADGDRVVVTFELPAGSYATELLRELLHPDGAERPI